MKVGIKRNRKYNIVRMIELLSAHSGWRQVTDFSFVKLNVPFDVNGPQCF